MERAGFWIILLQLQLWAGDSPVDREARMKLDCGLRSPSLSEAHAEAVTWSRVYVIITRSDSREPRFQVSPYGVPFFGEDIESSPAGGHRHMSKPIPLATR